MRIVAGRHKGRKIQSPDDGNIRPTSDRVRESVFNILDHSGLGFGGTSPVRDAHVLDAFCGTGALGLEALSRGAAHATFIDKDRRALELCRQNVALLGETGASTVLQGDCLKPARAANGCDLVFVDAPYGHDMVAPALEILVQSGWVNPNAICVIETGAEEILSLPDTFLPLDDRKYGTVRVRFFRFMDAP